MSKRSNYVGAALAVTLALGLPALGLAAEAQTKKTDEMQAQVDEAGPEFQDTSPSGGMKTLDAVAVRPVSFVSSVFSTGAYLLTLPFAALDPAIDAGKAGDNLVGYPFRDTFKRPLGDFSKSDW